MILDPPTFTVSNSVNMSAFLECRQTNPFNMRNALLIKLNLATALNSTLLLPQIYSTWLTQSPYNSVFSVITVAQSKQLHLTVSTAQIHLTLPNTLFKLFNYFLHFYFYWKQLPFRCNMRCDKGQEKIWHEANTNSGISRQKHYTLPAAPPEICLNCCQL